MKLCRNSAETGILRYSVLRISEMNGLFARTGAGGQKKIVYSAMKKEIG